MKIRPLPRVTLLLLVAAGLFGSAVAFAKPKDLELRGTVLCRALGDPKRERPADPRGLLVEPVGYPQGSEMVGDGGFFRVRVPYELLDHEVVLKIYSGRDQIDVMTVFLETAKVKRVVDKSIYSLSAHVLPGRCEDLNGSADTALQYRDQLRSQAPVNQAGFKLPGRALSGVIAAVLGAGAYAAQSGAGTGIQKQTNLKGGSYPTEPGLIPLYSQFSAAPMLGRTITSSRNFGEAALWNPSLLVHTAGNVLGGSGGVRNEWRGVGAYHIPYRQEKVPFYLPRVVTGGFMGVYWSHEIALGDGKSGNSTDLRHTENLASLGFGFAASDNVGFALNLHNYHQLFGPIDTIPGSGDVKTEVHDDRVSRDQQDVDLGITWDVSPEVRLGLAAYNLGGSQGLYANHEEAPQQRGVIGATILRDRFQIGGEIGLNPGETNAAAGLNYRITRLLAIDFAGGTRWETVQGGIDVTPGPVIGTFRIRRDTREKSAVHIGLGLNF